jgi:hypothetical protein
LATAKNKSQENKNERDRNAPKEWTFVKTSVGWKIQSQSWRLGSIF